jgi:hypothetical protein
MATIKHPKRCEGAYPNALTGTKREALTLSFLSQKGHDKKPKSTTKGAKKSPHPKLKNYLLHYAKGKYNLINLSLKKKGHEQKY